MQAHDSAPARPGAPSSVDPDGGAAGAHRAAGVDVGQLIVRAQAHRDQARFRLAFDEAEQAAHLSRVLRDEDSEAQALVVACSAASALGRNEEAVEAGLLATRIVPRLASGPLHAAAYNYLGVAYLWSRNLERAHECLARSVAAARLHGPAGGELHPLLNAVYVELVRMIDHRDAGVSSPTLDALGSRLDAVQAALSRGSGRMLTESLNHWPVNAAELVRAKGLALSGQVEPARQLLARMGGRLAQRNGAGWMGCFVDWTEAEVALAADELDQAQGHLDKMVENALAAEYEQLVCLGYRLMSQLAGRRGDHRQAYLHLQRMYQREWTLRAEAIASREAIVTWQMELRDSDDARRKLQAKAHRLERLSMEDSLTGLANRRAVVHSVEQWLSTDSPAPRLALAFLDLDRFKQVNDRFTHGVGDKVLRSLAALLRHAVRGDDLVGRLAGDEFVIVLPHSDLGTANEIVRRIQDMVAAHDWQAIAPGLTISLSAGVAQARPGDTVACLLDRSDTEMYAQKARRGLTPTV